MSLILDALKRAEHERKSAENASARAEEVTPQELPKDNSLTEKKRSNWIWMMLTGLTVLALVWGFTVRESEVSTFVSETRNLDFPKPDSTDKTVLDLPKKINQNPSQVLSSHPVAPASEVVNALYAENSSSLPNIEDIQVAQIYVESTNSSVAISESDVSVLSESVAVTNPLPDINEQLPKNLRTQPDARRISDTDAIPFDSLSFNQKQLFPSISYSQHNYLGNSASSVVINGELMRVGSRINQDLTIEEIVEDGVIFIFYNKRVSFRALSGWINM
jgi:Type II secretion system protein B